MKFAKVLAGVLSATIIFNGISLYPLGAEKSKNSKEEIQIVSSFDKLSDDILYQKVDYGTKLSELELPNYLSAVVDFELYEDELSTSSDASQDSSSATNSGSKATKIKVGWEINPSFSDAEEYDPELSGIYVFDAFLKDEDKYQLDAELPRIEVEVMSQPEIMNASEVEISGEGWSYDGTTSTVNIKSDEGLDEFKNNWNFETEIDNIYINEGVSSASGLGNIKAKNLYIDCTDISYYGFYNNDYIEYIEIGKNVEYIGTYAFKDCDSLKLVKDTGGEISGREIASEAFSNCDSLEYINLLADQIGPYAFLDCVSLEEVWIGNAHIQQKEWIGIGGQFKGCNSLKYVFIADNLGEIRNETFYGCEKLEHLALMGANPPEIDQGAFDNANPNLTIYTYAESLERFKSKFFELGYDFEFKIQMNCIYHYQEQDTDEYNWMYSSIEHWKECIHCGTAILKGIHKGGVATSTEKAICEVCGQPYGELAEKCQHNNLSSWKYDGEYHWKECLDCRDILSKEVHYGGQATFEKKAVCEVCGAEYGELLSQCQHLHISDWKCDTEYHWKECTDCQNVLYKGTHKGGTATDTEQAICDICGKHYGKLATEEHQNTDNDNNSSKKASGSSADSLSFASGINGNWKSVINSNGKVEWRFIRLDGTMLYNTWAYINNPYAASNQPEEGWFYFDNDGLMQTGWKLIGDNWYFLHDISDGILGLMQTGWMYDDSYKSWFYLDRETGAMYTGWKQIDGKWYFFEPEPNGKKGELYTGRITPDGHYVDDNGVKTD